VGTSKVTDPLATALMVKGVAVNVGGVVEDAVGRGVEAELAEVEGDAAGVTVGLGVNDGSGVGDGVEMTSMSNE